MKKRDASVSFSSIAVPTPTAAQPSTRGRPVDSDSLRQRLQRGELRTLRVTLPAELVRAVNVAAAAGDTTPSEVVASLLQAHLERPDRESQE